MIHLWPSDPGRGAYLTTDIPGIGGRIKQRPEDFLVEEQPLYQPAGKGEHIYLCIEKRDLSTLSAARILATHFGVHLAAVGYAGLKDKRAITRQVFSIHTPGKTPEDFPSLKHDRMAVQWADLHENKLRKGHLAGNRFSIRIRDVHMRDVLAAKRVLDRLERTGVPNRIGEQRFGYTGRNHLVGRAIIRARPEDAINALLAPRQDGETFDDAQESARQLFAQGNLRDAWQAFTVHSRTEKRVLAALVRGERPARAIAAIERPELEFYLSAFQSAVFNDVLARRLAAGSIDRLAPGDLAQKAHNRAVFLVTPEEAGPDLDTRVASFELSPSGPMWAASMMRAAGDTDDAERAALEASGVSLDDLAAFEQRRPNRLAGARRPLRVRLEFPDVEGGMDEHGSYVRVAFDLPRGAFATEVLREIMKPTGPWVGPDDDDSAPPAEARPETRDDT